MCLMFIFGAMQTLVTSNLLQIVNFKCVQFSSDIFRLYNNYLNENCQLRKIQCFVNGVLCVKFSVLCYFEFGYVKKKSGYAIG